MDRVGSSKLALLRYELAKVILERYSERVLLKSQDKLSISSFHVTKYFRLEWNLQASSLGFMLSGEGSILWKW
jgi:hypothetical protein